MSHVNYQAANDFWERWKGSLHIKLSSMPLTDSDRDSITKLVRSMCSEAFAKGWNLADIKEDEPDVSILQPTTNT